MGKKWGSTQKKTHFLGDYTIDFIGAKEICKLKKNWVQQGGTWEYMSSFCQDRDWKTFDMEADAEIHLKTGGDEANSRISHILWKGFKKSVFF